MTEQAVFYDIVRVRPGTLVLNLPSYDSTAQNRKVVIPYNVEKVRVPRMYALGIFVDGTLEQMYKEGSFRVEPSKQFEEEVAAIFFPVENKANVLPQDKVLELLTKGNRVRIKELAAESDVNRTIILTVAREHIGEIPSSMIADLEKMFGVELTVENE